MSDLKFEDGLARLEQIVTALESGNLPLEESLRVFEEGVTLARHCAKYLDEAERKIEILARDERSGREIRSAEPFTLLGS